MTIRQALELLKLPRLIGSHKEEKVTAAIGRFGPYIKFGSVFASIPKDKDIFEITITEAIEIIEAKLQAEAEKLIKSFKEDDTLEILKGRWGPYIAQGKAYYKIPKDTEISTITYSDVMAIIEKAGPAPAKKAAAKSAD
jgi:DNA topoisomerase-1